MNEVRKAFTFSERVAIKRAIEGRIGERRGERTDLQGELVANWPQVPAPGEKTREFAARAAGLGG